MSIGWIAEDVAELTGSAIGTWDFPVTVRKSMDNYRSYAGTGSNECAYAISHKHQTHLHVISQRDLETAQHRSKNELREFLIECSHRLADCCGCERLLLKMSVNLCLTSKSVLSVVDDLLSYFHSRRESLHNLQAELSNALASQTDDSYEPQLSDIEETLTALILHSLVKLVATGTSSDEPFWRIEDDMKAVDKYLDRSSRDFFEECKIAGYLRSSYIRCVNCGEILLENENGTPFPYCPRCFEWRND